MRVEKLFKRLKREFLKINFLQACLDSILFFLTANLGLFLFSLRFTSAGRNLEFLVPITVIIFLGDFYYRSQKYNIEIYEEKNPELRERLRTARDNIDSNNIVSQALFDEILDLSRSVSSESIIPSKKIIRKMIAIGIISFLTVMSGLLNFQVIEEGREIIPDTDELVDQINGGEDEIELQNGSDIYGEEADIPVSENLIDYNITGRGVSQGVSSSGESRSPDSPSLGGTFSQSGEDLQLAKEYSLAIREMQ
jgi:hypothetical protein